MCTQPSKFSAGGVAMYVNNKLDHFKKDDLDILHEDFKSIWTEIKNKKEGNFLRGFYLTSSQYCYSQFP